MSQSLSILKQSLPESHPKIATGYHEMGRILFVILRGIQERSTIDKGVIKKLKHIM